MTITSACMSCSREGTGLVARLKGARLRRPEVAQRLSEDLALLLDDLPSPQEVRLDLGRIQWMSSLVLNQLILFNSQARSRGVPVLMVHVQPAVREVFVLTRLDRMFQIEDSAEPAALAPPVG